MNVFNRQSTSSARPIAAPSENTYYFQNDEKEFLLQEINSLQSFLKDIVHNVESEISKLRGAPMSRSVSVDVPSTTQSSPLQNMTPFSPNSSSNPYWEEDNNKSESNTNNDDDDWNYKASSSSPVSVSGRKSGQVTAINKSNSEPKTETKEEVKVEPKASTPPPPQPSASSPMPPPPPPPLHPPAQHDALDTNNTLNNTTLNNTQQHNNNKRIEILEKILQKECLKGTAKLIQDITS